MTAQITSTRSRQELPASLTWLLLLAAVLLGPARSGADEVEHRAIGSPLEAKGEIHFMVDAVILQEGVGNSGVYLFVGLPQDELTCIELAGRAGLWVQLTTCLRLLDRAGDSVERLTRSVDIPCKPAEQGVAFQRHIVRLHAPFPANITSFELELQDRNAVRRGLVHQISGDLKGGIVRGRPAKPASRAGLRLAGPLLLWEAIELGGGQVQNGYQTGPADQMRAVANPNPTHTYGVFKPTLTFYLEAYGEGAQDLSLALRVRALADSLVLLENRTGLRLPGPRTGIQRQLDISRLPAGSYALEVAAVNGPAPRASAARTATVFQVQWDPESWTKTSDQLLEEAALLLEDGQWEHYCTLPPGEREAYMNGFWQQMAGYGVGTDHRPVRAIFHERLATAMARYGRRRDGRLNDRGRTYVRFGEPDEIHKELNPQDDTMLFYFLEREIDDSERVVDGGKPRRHPMDISSYEVWYYMNRGEPLSPAWAARARDQSLRFIFVNELGLGDHRLIYSNLRGGGQ